MGKEKCRPTTAFPEKARWIGNGTAKPFYARLAFEVSEAPLEARLAVTGLGQFEAYINGRKVGDHVIDPGWTNYHKQIQYVVFDAAEYLRPGVNVIGLSAGNGWYIGDKPDERHFMPKDEAYLFPGDKGYRPYGTCLAALAELRLTFPGGGAVVIGTDSTWKTHKSATTTANVYGSEDFDARLWPAGWNAAAFDDSGWPFAVELEEGSRPHGELCLQEQPPVIVKEIVEPVSRVQRKDGVLFDFGTNMAALFEVTVRGKAGDAVKLTPVEKLDASGAPEKTVETWCVYTLAGMGVETWKPSFSYATGRWLFVEGAAVGGEGPCVLGSRAYRITSASKDSGTFHCSDERYNKIFAIIHRSIENNLVHVHTDCPQIEKLGWLEATHLMAPSLMYNKDMRPLFRKILRDIREAQYSEGECDITPSGQRLHGSGLVPGIAPTYSKVVTDVTTDGLGGCDFVDSIAWGACIVFLPLSCYDFYGDAAVLQENYAAAECYMRYVESGLDENGLLSGGLGDWGAPGFDERVTENVDTAIYFLALKALARVSRVLGKAENAARYDAKAGDLQTQYNALFLKQEAGAWVYMPLAKWPRAARQSCQALPLYAGLAPDYARRDVAKALVESVRQKGFHCGEIGLRFIIQTLDALGERDLLSRVIMRKEHPSYLRFVEMGETTLPEFWRDDARSRCHDMLGHIMEWFYSGMAGIVSAQNAFEKIRVSPWIPADMRELHCRYDSVRGTIALSLQRTPAGLDASITIPQGSVAALDFSKMFVAYRLDGAEQELRGGEHRFAVIDLSNHDSLNHEY
jgi:hypothetical protein